MTENIRIEGGQIEVLSRYQELMKERQLKEFMRQEARAASKSP
jgi:hypothetical protein